MGEKKGSKLTPSQQEIVDAMKRGEKLVYHRNRNATRSGGGKYYELGDKDVKKSVVQALEKKGVIEIDYTKTNERVGYGYWNISYLYALTKKV